MNDTSEQAARIQMNIYRRLDPAVRLRLAYDMSMFVRALALARLKEQHPTWSHTDLQRELTREVLADSLFQQPR